MPFSHSWLLLTFSDCGARPLIESSIDQHSHSWCCWLRLVNRVWYLLELQAFHLFMLKVGRASMALLHHRTVNFTLALRDARWYILIWQLFHRASKMSNEIFLWDISLQVRALDAFSLGVVAKSKSVMARTNHDWHRSGIPWGWEWTCSKTWCKSQLYLLAYFHGQGSKPSSTVRTSCEINSDR